jgi:hypothetical protein
METKIPCLDQFGDTPLPHCPSQCVAVHFFDVSPTNIKRQHLRLSLIITRHRVIIFYSAIVVCSGIITCIHDIIGTKQSGRFELPHVESPTFSLTIRLSSAESFLTLFRLYLLMKFISYWKWCSRNTLSALSSAL